jgi:hypothetical protein
MWMLLAVGCSTDLTPTWAWDPIWLEGADDGVHGFQTWQVYGADWDRKQKDKSYVCSVLTELTGLPSTCDAPTCVAAFDVEPTVLETDCAEASLAENPLFTSLQRLALGDPYAGDDAPWPGRTTATFADYGNGWEPHGFAYPEAYDTGGAGDPVWTGADPFLFTPEAAFPIE